MIMTGNASLILMALLNSRPITFAIGIDPLEDTARRRDQVIAKAAGEVEDG